jgi:phosphatidylglycerophosphatase A
VTDRAETRRVALSTPTGFLAFGFGSGLSPVAPGTAGTLAAVPFALLLKALPAVAFWPLWAALALVGIWLCGATARRLGVHDHGGIVWDEMVGYWLAVALVPMHWAWLLAGFVLFRVFDIVKPWPIRALDRRLAGGFGVMADDVAAGAATLALLALAQHLLG